MGVQKIESEENPNGGGILYIVQIINTNLIG